MLTSRNGFRATNTLSFGTLQRYVFALYSSANDSYTFQCPLFISFNISSVYGEILARFKSQFFNSLIYNSYISLTLKPPKYLL